jgi:hypothetical protein
MRNGRELTQDTTAPILKSLRKGSGFWCFKMLGLLDWRLKIGFVDGIWMKKKKR